MNKKQVTAALNAGCELIRHFDVWGGYWWTLRPTGEKVLRRTVDALVFDNVISAGENKRVHSGYQEMAYVVNTPKDEGGGR